MYREKLPHSDHCNYYTHVRLVLEVDGVAVALLQDAGVEVVLVLRVQLPTAADVLARHVVAAHLCRLDVPHDGGAARVLVADLNRRCRDAVHAL